MKVATLLTAISLLASTAFADQPAQTVCPVLRQADVRLQIYRRSFKLNNGQWSSTDELICNTSGITNVFDASSLCRAPADAVLTCETTLNGKAIQLSASNEVFVSGNPQREKNFAANIVMKSDTKQFIRALAFTEDLNASNIGVAAYSARSYDANGQPKAEEVVLVRAHFIDHVQ